MPVYSAFSQIDPANDKGFVRIKTPYSIPYHVGNASGNWDWPIAMTAYLKGNYILVRDVATNDDGQPAAHQDQNPDFYLVYSAKGWDTKVVRNHYRTSSSTGRRAIREGDGVAILTFHIGDDDMVLDASYMANQTLIPPMTGISPALLAHRKAPIKTTLTTGEYRRQSVIRNRR